MYLYHVQCEKPGNQHLKTETFLFQLRELDTRVIYEHQLQVAQTDVSRLPLYKAGGNSFQDAHTPTRCEILPRNTQEDFICHQRKI